MTELRHPVTGPCALPRRIVRAGVAALAAAAVGLAVAHATIVFGTLSVEPNPPPVDAPLTFELRLHDPSGTPVEAAVIRVEVGSVAPGDAIVPGPAPATGAPGEPAAAPAEPVAETSATEVSPGRYRARVTVPAAGPYQILIRDLTFRQEEATQIVSLRLGTGEPVEPVDFVLPPTTTGGGLGAWLIWLVAVPLVAGVVVTILVMRAGPQTEPPEAGGETGADRG